MKMEGGDNGHGAPDYEAHDDGHMVDHDGGMGHTDHEGMLQDLQRRFIVSVLVTIPILALTPDVQSLLGYKLEFSGAPLLLFLPSSFVYFYGGWPFLKGFRDEVKDRTPGMMTLIALAISVAYVYSNASVLLGQGSVFFWELATLIDIMLLGHWAEMRSVIGASRALEQLVKLLPSEAHLAKDEGMVDVKVEMLKIGDRVLVKPGERIPVDGIVTDGETEVNESMLTGESRPVSKAKGAGVIGGSVNGEGSIVVQVSRMGKETYLNQIIELVRTAQASRSRTQDLADRAALLLVIVALTAGILTLALWLFGGAGLSFAIERAVTVLVISCPHALGLAIPLVVAVSTALAARSGFLIRDRQAFERARNVDAIVFDKTGTLTEGRFGIVEIVPLADMDEETIVRLTASLESRSEHSIAKGIMEHLEEIGVRPSPVDGFRALPGRGVEGTVEGRKLTVVSPGHLDEVGITIKDERISRVLERMETVVFLVEGSQPLGAIALADVVRKESKEAIHLLKDMGYKCVMLTGDNKFVARAVAEELGMDEYFAEVLPNEKARSIERIQQRYTAAMIGDGVNDAPALVQADVGIAIGAGTDVAIESADIVLVRNDPRDVANVLSLSKRTYSKMFQNLIYATGYNVIAIPLAAGVLYGSGILLTPAIGAVLMSISTVVVAINARLLRPQRRKG